MYKIINNYKMYIAFHKQIARNSRCSDHIHNIVDDILSIFIYFNEYHIAGVMRMSPEDELIQFETC
jgi:phosphate starvation-inducible membrane PsiE